MNINRRVYFFSISFINLLVLIKDVRLFFKIRFLTFPNITFSFHLERFQQKLLI